MWPSLESMAHKKTHFRSPLVLSVTSWRTSLIGTSLPLNFSDLGAPFLSQEQSLGYNLIKWSFKSVFTVTLFILRNFNFSFMAMIRSFLLKLLLVEQCFQEQIRHKLYLAPKDLLSHAQMNKNVPSAGERLNLFLIPIVGEGTALKESEEGLCVLLGRQDTWLSDQNTTQRV